MNLLEVKSKREEVINKVIEKENELIKAKTILYNYSKNDKFSSYEGKLNALLEIGKIEYSIDILKELKIELLGVFDNE